MLASGRVVYKNAPPAVVAAGTRGPVTATLTLTNNAEIIAAPGGGLAIFVTSVKAGNTSATLTRLDLKDGTTTRDSQPLAASGGGYMQYYDPPWQLAANSALNGALGTAVTDVRVNVNFYVTTPR